MNRKLNHRQSVIVAALSRLVEEQGGKARVPLRNIILLCEKQGLLSNAMPVSKPASVMATMNALMDRADTGLIIRKVAKRGRGSGVGDGGNTSFEVSTS